MDAVLNWLWQGCVVALALLVMLRLLERARANVRYVVCWAALLLVVALPALPWLGSLGLRQDALGLPPPVAIVSVPDAWWTSGTVMAVVWTVWASVYAVRFAWAMVALRRARERSRAFPAQVETLLPHWRQIRDEGRRPMLVLSDTVTTAAVLGCGAPVIAVAPSLVRTLDADELDRVLIHEWAHVQRRDDLVNILQVVVRIVAGWHPAAWWIDRRLHIEREIACDEMTVELTGSARSYAACLVKLAGLKGATRTALAAPAVVTASGLRGRVTRIVSRRAFIAPLWSRGLAAGVVSALCAVSVGVGGLTLVEATVLALPFESLGAIGAGVERNAAIATPTIPPRVEPAPSLRQGRAATPLSPRPNAKEPPPVTPAAADPEPLPSNPAGAVNPEGLRAIPHSIADTTAVAPPAAVVDAVPTEPTEVTAESERSPWSAAADGGAAIGRQSKEAGVATAGFFTRFVRRVAGSF